MVVFHIRRATYCWITLAIDRALAAAFSASDISEKNRAILNLVDDCRRMTMASVAETQAQATRPRTAVSEQESLQLTRNLLRIAMSNISYVRGFFPENFYREKFVPALDMKVNKLLPMDMESKRFIDWTEKGVFDALQKKYLKTLFLTICRGQDGPPIEEYTFSFKYGAEGASENITSMTIESSSGVPVYTDTNNQMSPLQIKQSACQMVRMLVQLMYTLDDIPKERTIVMRLHYYDDITPEDYEPPLFMSSTGDDPNPWDYEPFKMDVGHVDGRHYELAIKVKSVLDPCDDWHDLAETVTCSSDLLLTSDDDSSTSSEKVAVNTPSSQLCSPPIQKVSPRMDSPIQASEYKEQIQEPIVETGLAESLKPMQSTAEDKVTDNIEHPVWGVRRKRRKREELATDVIDITDEFSQLSEVGRKCRVHQLKEGRWSNDTQQCSKLKTKSPHSNAKSKMVIEAEKNKEDPLTDNVEQILYEKALLHTLPREHITMKQLQQGLVDVNPAILKKLMSQMCRDGYIESTPRVRRKGRQVFHNPEADKKLQSLRAFFDAEMRDKEETKINKCANRELSQSWEGRILRNRTCSILQNITKKEQSKTLEDSVSGRKQALGSDITRQGLPIQQKHSPANNSHTKGIPTLQESLLPQKGMHILAHQKQVAERKKVIKALENNINLLEETETMETENEANTFGRLQKKLDKTSQGAKGLRDRAVSQDSALSETIEDSVERAKASTQSEQSNVTPSTLGFKRKRVRFQESGSPEDIFVDCTLHLKARKVDGPVDGAIYRSLLERTRAEKYGGVARKGDDPYHFDTAGADKSLKRKFRGNSLLHQASIHSLIGRPQPGTHNIFDSVYESDEQAETLNAREKTRHRFLQRGTALQKCPRPAVYVRRSRVA